MTLFEKGLLWSLAVIAIVAIFAGPVKADEGFNPRIGWMPTSHHFFDRTNNEKHKGVILEFVKKDEYFGVTSYVNSNGDDSVWMYIGKDIKFNKYWYYGYQYGLVTGYAISPAPVVTGTVTVPHGEALSSRLTILPVVVGYNLLWEFN